MKSPDQFSGPDKSPNPSKRMRRLLDEMGQSMARCGMAAFVAVATLAGSPLWAGFQCACSRIQTVDGGFGARDQLVPGSWLVGLGYSYQQYSDDYDGAKVTNMLGRITYQNVVDASLEYSLGKHWTLGAQVPYTWVRNVWQATGAVNTTNNIGDLRLLVKASLGPKGGHGLTPQFIPLISLSLPTGQFDPGLGNYDIGTGLGVPSIGTGASAVWALVGGIGETWLGGRIEQPLGQNTAGFEFGTAVEAEGGIFLGLFRGSGLSLAASYESYGPDHFQGNELAFRQGQFVYLSPGLQLSLNRGWSLNVNEGWLVNAWTGGDQLVAPGRSSLSMARVF